MNNTLDNKRQYIICAAMRYKHNFKYANQPKNISNGIVITGLNYNNCKTILEMLLINDYNFLNSRINFNDEIVEGFLTSDNLFVDKKVAVKIAFNSGQINNITIDYLSPQDIY